MEKPESPTPTTSESEIWPAFENLPDVVLGKIMSYLHWKEKQLLAIASSRIRTLIQSAFAWESFENDRNYAFRKLFKFMQFSLLLEQEIEVIRLYGKYFQRCKLWLYSMDLPHLHNSKWEMGNIILKAVSAHCKRLKWLCIVHPSDATFGDLQYSNDYINSLRNIVSRQHQSCSLSLRNLFYSSMDMSISVIDNYLFALGEAQLLQNVTCLDISHGLISDRTYQPVSNFKRCSNLSILKCPIHVVNTNIVVDLCLKKLVHLYLVNDEHTNEQGYWEASFVDWAMVNAHMDAKKRNRFEVHYIFQNRPLDSVDLVPNRFVKSVVFSNLTCSISSTLLHLIADTYGSTLENLAFCSNHWEFLMHFTDLHEIDNSFSYVGRTCKVLKSFISCLKLPSSAISSLVRNSTSLKQVRVYRDNVIFSIPDLSAQRFQENISLYVGESSSGWQMVNRGDSVFEIPNINSILFDSCFREL